MSHRVWIGGITVQATHDEFKNFITEHFGNVVTMWKFSVKPASGKIGKGHKYCTVTLIGKDAQDKMIMTKELKFKGVKLIFDGVWTKRKQMSRFLASQGTSGPPQNQFFPRPGPGPRSGRNTSGFHRLQQGGNALFPSPGNLASGPFATPPTMDQNPIYPQSYGYQMPHQRAPLSTRHTGAGNFLLPKSNNFPNRNARPPFSPFPSKLPFPNRKRKHMPGFSNTATTNNNSFKSQRQFLKRKQPQKFNSNSIKSTSPVTPPSPVPSSPTIVPETNSPSEIPQSPVSPKEPSDNPEEFVENEKVEELETKQEEEEDDSKYVMKQKDFGVVTIIEEIGRSLYPLPSWGIASSIKEWYDFGIKKFPGLSEVTESEFAALLHRWLCITHGVEWEGGTPPDEDIELVQPWASRLLSDDTPSPAHLSDKNNVLQESQEHFL